MVRFQVRKDGVGFIVIPKPVWKQKGWEQGTELSLVEREDGSMIIREIQKQNE